MGTFIAPKPCTGVFLSRFRQKNDHRCRTRTHILELTSTTPEPISLCQRGGFTLIPSTPARWLLSKKIEKTFNANLISKTVKKCHIFPRFSLLHCFPIYVKITVLNQTHICLLFPSGCMKRSSTCAVLFEATPIYVFEGWAVKRGAQRRRIPLQGKRRYLKSHLRRAVLLILPQEYHCL